MTIYATATPTFVSHPVCRQHMAPEVVASHAHRVYVGGQPGERLVPGVVSMREELRYAIDFAEPTIGSDAAEVAQIAADKDAGQRLMAMTPDADGYALVDDETFAAVKRMVDDAREYASMCGYADDPTCEPIERAAAGFGLVCWPTR